MRLTRFTSLTVGTLLAALALATPAALAEKGDPVAPKGDTTQEIYQKTKIADPHEGGHRTQLVLTDLEGVRVIKTSAGLSVVKSLRSEGLSPYSYHTEDGAPLTKKTLATEDPLFLFKVEYKGSATRIEIPRPVTRVRVNGIPEGTKILQEKGEDGLGMLTTVTATDLSADRLRNGAAKPDQGVTTTETLTVISPPKPRVLLVGAVENLTDLGDSKPIEGECSNGSSVPTTVDPDIIAVHRAVCIQFPDITTYGTYRDGCPITCDHHDGLAVDIMVSGDPGWLVAQYLAANAALYNINYLIYQQQIWEPERPYWRKMEDRGSPTANHMDHVHVSVYP